MKKVTGLCVAVALLLAVVASVEAFTDQNFENPWTFTCEGTGDAALCVKSEADAAAPVQYLNHCKLICGTYGPLWPRPRAIPTLGTELSGFTTAKMTESTSVPAEVQSLVTEAVAIFKNHLDMYHPEYNWIDGTAPWGNLTDPSVSNRIVHISITVTDDNNQLLLETNESYDLTITEVGDVTTATITAPTFFGARHALETLSQLINYNEQSDCLQIVNSASILSDAPVFPYRGLIVDTSRNYISVKELEKTLDAMSSTKLNSFHWHITDTHSFPIVMETLPKMHQYGAYSARKLYSTDEIRGLVQYGLVRGIRVIPEFDAPAHVGNGWQWGPQENLGNLTVCVNQEPWQEYCSEPPCGQLNIANENMYGVLDKVYKEILDAFQPIELFHFGGDEVNMNCWNTSTEIVEWIQTVGDGQLTRERYLQEWVNFQDKAYDLITANNNATPTTGIIWTSELTASGNADKYLDKNKYIIQIWTNKWDPSIQELLSAGFRVIFSNYDAWYFDCGSSAWLGEGNNWCSPYIGWQTVYDNNPYRMAESEAYYPLVMGGEAAMWSEQVDGVGLDARLWPRGAALGERLWTNPSTFWDSAEIRLVHHRQRMVQRGIAAERLQPEWCFQNEGLCVN